MTLLILNRFGTLHASRCQTKKRHGNDRDHGKNTVRYGNDEKFGPSTVFVKRKAHPNLTENNRYNENNRKNDSDSDRSISTSKGTFNLFF